MITTSYRILKWGPVIISEYTVSAIDSIPISRSIEVRESKTNPTNVHNFWLILSSTLTSVASDLLNDALWLDNKLSARPPRGKNGQWTEVKIQLDTDGPPTSRLKKLVNLTSSNFGPEDQNAPNFTAICNVTPTPDTPTPNPSPPPTSKAYEKFQ